MDADRFDEVMQYRWCVVPGRTNTYAMCKNGRQTVLLHHLIIGKPPKGMVVDHASRDGLDNRLCNLRICTVSQNQFNRKARGNSVAGLKGVSFHPDCTNNPWQASCRWGGKAVHLGFYPTKEEAHLAYVDFASKHHNEFFCAGQSAPVAAPVMAATDPRPLWGIYKNAIIVFVEKYGVWSVSAKSGRNVFFIRYADTEAQAKEFYIEYLKAVKGFKENKATADKRNKYIYQSGIDINPWLVKVTVNNARKYLGVFPTIAAAQQARDEFLSKHTEATHS